jgi:hypothetical protein
MCKLDRVTHKLNKFHKSNMQIKMESLQWNQNNLQKQLIFHCLSKLQLLPSNW